MSPDATPSPDLSLALADGTRVPAVGLGTWKIDRAETPELVHAAIACGYRHIDCACDYGNETEVGGGIHRALTEGLVRRDELWITSKLWNTYHHPDHVRAACERSLHDLGLDYLDLYLIHFPIPQAYIPIEERYPPGWFVDPDVPSPRMELAPVAVSETWGAMEALVEAGLVRQIGVSNFNVALIRDLLSHATINPAMLQVERHPYLAQAKLLRFCDEQGIGVTGFSPLGAPSYVPLGMATAADSAMTETVVQDAAHHLDVTPAQVLLRWAVQRGCAVIPKTRRVERLRENLALDDFALSEAQMNALDLLDRNHRFNDPGVFCETGFNTFCPIFE
ncbi:MAG: aldo/keto reductase [Lentisphaerae bacterium]|nr:aldo/keto reductase [Lentisphaerota bacterium]